MKRSSEPQTVLDRYRASLSPPVAMRERVWAELAQRVAVGEAPSLPEASPPPALPAVPAGLGWGPVLLAGACGVSALIAAAWIWPTRHAPAAPPVPARESPSSSAIEREAARDRPGPSPQPSAQSVAPRPPQAAEGSSSPAAGEREVVAPRVRASARSAEPSRVAGNARRDGAANASAAGAVSSPVPGASGSSFAPFGAAQDRSVPRFVAPDAVEARAGARERNDDAVTAASQLEEELRLLRSAYEALSADRPKRALSRLGEHAVRFPHGALVETREVTRIMALCQAGERDVARAEAAHFLERWPRSPHAGRVRSLCVDAGEAP